MFVRGLRTKIAVTVAILLFLGMFLIDLVTMVTLRRELIRSEVLKANTLLAFVEDVTGYIFVANSHNRRIVQVSRLPDCRSTGTD